MISAKRAYDDGCAAAHALNLVGDRWSLLVVRELLLGVRRFMDLRAGLPGISANILTQRLEELEEHGVVHRRKLAPPASVWVYELTPWGHELEPVLCALDRWGARSPALPRSAPMSTASVILSLRTMFEASAAKGLSARLAITLGHERFHARVHQGRFLIERGDAGHPDAALFAPPEALAALVYGRHPLAQALVNGEVRIEGDRRIVERFLTLFPRPSPAPGAGVASAS